MEKTNHTMETDLNRDALEELERMLIRRWKQLYPEWGMVIISLPQKDAEMRRRILDQVKATYTSQEFEDYCKMCSESGEHNS